MVFNSIDFLLDESERFYEAYQYDKTRSDFYQLSNYYMNRAMIIAAGIPTDIPEVLEAEAIYHEAMLGVSKEFDRSRSLNQANRLLKGITQDKTELSENFLRLVSAV